jgi:non-heme chloroperoxidase
MRKLHLDRPVIAGSSQGGTYAAEVAIQAGGLITGAVVIDGGGHWGLVTHGVADRLARLRAALIADRPAALQAWVPGWFGPAVGTGMHAWTIRQILDASPYIDPILSEQADFDQRPRLPDVNVPVTWIHGELDSIPVSIAEESAQLVPGGDVVVIDGAAHMPHLEQPARFEQELRRVLSAMR